MEYSREITSANNEQIKEYAKLGQKKYRSLTDKFLLEGKKSIAEAFLVGVEIESIFILKGANNEKYEWLKEPKEVILVSESVMKKLSTTESAPEIIGVGRQVHYRLEDLKAEKNILLVENIKDSGNLGTIIRSASALGAGGIVLVGDTVDLYNPKTVRASVGSVFKIPVVEVESGMPFVEIKRILSGHKFLAGVVGREGAVSIFDVKATNGCKTVLMMGSEAFGLSDEAIAVADVEFTIPIRQDIESLNLAMATVISLWELFGQS